VTATSVEIRGKSFGIIDRAKVAGIDVFTLKR
jgi:hypothetical protein